MLACVKEIGHVCTQARNMSVLFCKRFLNLIVILCVITPATVNYWRATWYILDLFVFPDDGILSASTTLAASFGAMFLIMLVEDYLKEFLNERTASKGLYLVLFYPLSFMTVASWRGLWMLLDYYTTTSLTSACVSHAIGFLIVLSLKTTSTIIGVPGYCVSERHVDPSKNILNVKLCLRNKTACSRIVNSFVTVFVIGSGVISYWRGTWHIVAAMEHASGTKLNISSIIALGLGYTVLCICYCLSEYISTFKLNLPYSLLMRALEQIFVYILGFGVVASWVAIWQLMDIYLLPDQPIASALVGHFAGIVVLYLFQGSLNAIAPPGTCRFPDNEVLDGFDLGSYLKRGSDEENTTPRSHVDETTILTTMITSV